MRKYLKTIFVVLVIASAVSCKKKSDDECPACPSVQSLSPSSGKYGIEVTISGINFNPSYTENIVKFNGHQVDPTDIISGSSTELKVKVPKGCGTGPVTVDVDADLTNYGTPPVFTYELTQSIIVYAGEEGTSGNPAIPVALDQPQFNQPSDILIDNAGIIYVLDKQNNAVKKFDPSISMFRTITGITDPACIFLDQQNNLYIAENSGTICTISKCVSGSFSITNYKFLTIDTYGIGVTQACIDNQLNIYASIINQFGEASTVAVYPNAGSDSMLFSTPLMSSMKLKDSLLYASVNMWTGFSTIPFVVRGNIHTGAVDTVVTQQNCSVTGILGGMAMKQNNLFISDRQSGLIYSVTSSGTLELFVNTPFNFPSGMAFDNAGNLYVAENNTHCIKKIVFE